MEFSYPATMGGDGYRVDLSGSCKYKVTAAGCTKSWTSSPCYPADGKDGTWAYGQPVHAFFAAVDTPCNTNKGTPHRQTCGIYIGSCGTLYLSRSSAVYFKVADDDRRRLEQDRVNRSLSFSDNLLSLQVT